MNTPLFYRPPGGWLADVMPLAHDGEFWLYHLLDRRDGSGVSWALVKTSDFLTFSESHVILPSGGADALDFNVYTGSVVREGSQFHAYYTGQNPRILDPVTGEPLQVVLHAVSDDGQRRWQRVSEDVLRAPSWIEPSDWRDPFVRQCQEDGSWQMLLAARRRQGPHRRRGLIVEAVADSAAGPWRDIRPFWEPGLYMAHECPDLFEMDGLWYLVYSEYSEAFTTRYRRATSARGPWELPDLDTLDGRAFYAAKTAELDGRRFAFGWISTRTGETDSGAWEWGGCLAVHEIHQQADGALAFGLPAEIRKVFTERLPVTLRVVSGDWGLAETMRVSAPASYACAVAEQQLPSQFLLRIDLDADPRSAGVGVLLRASPDGDIGYVLRFEPRRQRITLDRWPRRINGPAPWGISGDVPHAVELERPVGSNRKVVLEILVDGDVLVAYANSQVALTTRIYDLRRGALGLFVSEGSAEFAHVCLLSRSDRSRGTTTMPL